MTTKSYGNNANDMTGYLLMLELMHISIKTNPTFLDETEQVNIQQPLQMKVKAHLPKKKFV